MSADVVGMCRVLWSRDSFLTTLGTELVFSYREQTEFLHNCARIDRPLIGNIAVGWRVLRHLVTTQGYDARILNALLQFSLAGRSAYLDQACAHLELALRIVFKAVGKDTTAEEVAVGVAQMLGQSEFEGNGITKLLRDTFGVRNDLIEHGCVDQLRVCDYAPRAYRLTAGVFRRLLLNEDLAIAVNARETA